jgi:Notch-like protein
MLVVLVTPAEFAKVRVAFLRQLSELLRVVVVVGQDSHGNDIISSWPDGGTLARKKRSVIGDHIFPLRSRRASTAGSKVGLKLDNSQCSASQCMSTSTAAQFLSQSLRQGFQPAAPIYSVHDEPDPSDSSFSGSPQPWVVGVSVVLAVIFVILVFGVIVGASRKRSVTTWFPDGFFDRRRLDSGRNRNQPSTSSEEHASGSDSVTTTSETCSDFESMERPANKRHKRDILDGVAHKRTDSSAGSSSIDRRSWTRAHLDAHAGNRTPKPSIYALTPPQGACALAYNDFDMPGPGGLTPLMVASMASGGADVLHRRVLPGHGIEVTTKSAAIIQDLIHEGADMRATTDFSGETPLHLAARYSRADAAKRLLEGGADPMAKDNSGRTPLHSAIAADARGVFQILMNHRAAQGTVGMSMNDGTTPLMTAVKLALEEIVEHLLSVKVDVNATDVHGKTAIHWAAAVNNSEAAESLIRHGANVDAQDNHNQTPLFLAAREGSFEVAQLLLVNGSANANLADHMDCLPYDIARDRHHMDIMRLIESHNNASTASSGMRQPVVGSYGVQQNGGVTSSALPMLLPSLTTSAAKSRLKKTSSSMTAGPRKPSQRLVNSEASSDHNDDSLLRNGAASRRQPRPPPDQIQLQPECGATALNGGSVVVAQKKVKRRRPPPAAPNMAASVATTLQQEQRAAPVDIAADHQLFGSDAEIHRQNVGCGSSSEQPPPYEHAINGRRQASVAFHMGNNGNSSLSNGGTVYSPMNGAMPGGMLCSTDAGDTFEQLDINRNSRYGAMLMVSAAQATPNHRQLPASFGTTADGLIGSFSPSDGHERQLPAPQGGNSSPLGEHFPSYLSGGGAGMITAGQQGQDFNMCGGQQQSACRTSGAVVGRRAQPLSPVHMQIIHRQQQHTVQGYDVAAAYAAQLVHGGTSNGSSSENCVLPASATAGNCHMSAFPYPTPPSHHGSIADPTSPPMISQTSVLQPPPISYLNGYPTPSPDASVSPGQWSSSSPHSAKSDWSEYGRNSSPQRVPLLLPNASMTVGHGIKNEPAYL